VDSSHYKRERGSDYYTFVGGARVNGMCEHGLRPPFNGHNLFSMFTRLSSSARRIHFAGWVAIGLWILPSLKGVALVSPEPGGQDEFLVRNWDLDEGLPSTCINAVARTRDGYVWLGTQHGLARFDGIRFVTFNTENTPTLKDNRITALATDPQGNLWIGTGIGTLTRYDRDKFIALDLTNATQGKVIHALTADAAGNLWLGTAGAGLIKVKDGRVETLGKTNGLPSLNILQMQSDPQGRIWYLAAPGKLGWVENGNVHDLDLEAALPAAILAFALANDGGLWLATADGKDSGTRIFKFKNGVATEERQAYPWLQNSRRARPSALLEDQSGQLWLGTSGEGVFFQSATGPWQKLATPDPESQIEVLCLREDEGRSVWIGTRTSGLNQSVPRPVSILQLPATYNQNVLLTVCVRHDGSVWGGTDGAGVFRWQNSELNHVGKEQGLAGLQVSALLEDARSNLWAGTGAGLFLYQNGQFQLTENENLQKKITTLYENSQGKLWVGTVSGMIGGTSGEEKLFNQSNGLPTGPIVAMTEDRTGNLWVAVEGFGLFYQDGDRFKHWTPREGTADALQRWGKGISARSLLSEKDGSLWVATYGLGLFHIAGEKIRKWAWEKQELPSNHLFALLADDASKLWISSENGIFSFTQKSLLNYQDGNSPRPIPVRLTRAEGLSSKVCSGVGQPTATKSPDGRLWFPDGNTVAVFDPATLPRDAQTRPPIIEEIRVDGVPKQLTGDSIRILPGARSFQIYFTSPNILSAARLLFRYRLKELEKNWELESPEHSAHFSRLAPGHYTFQVMVCNDYGVWNPEIAKLRLTVVPQFWQTRWFQITAGLFLLGCAGLAARQMERARNRRKLAGLEHERALEEERARIARDIHDDLGANLTQVALLGDMAGDRIGSPEELREQTRQISSAAREMSQSLEAIVWAVRPQNDSLLSLVKYLRRRTDEMFESRPRQYHFAAPEEIPDYPVHAEVRHNVFLTYKEALTNALKHAQTGMVRIALTCSPEICQIDISDDGNGFDLAQVRADGTGLKNMRHRMEAISGGFELKSEPGRGTTVRLHFPLREPDHK